MASFLEKGRKGGRERKKGRKEERKDKRNKDKKERRKGVRRDYFCKGSSAFNLHQADGKISQNGETFSIPTLSSKDYKNK